MISILKVDRDHRTIAASRHPSIQIHRENIGGWWKVSLGEWRKEIITSLHLRSSMVQRSPGIMGSSGQRPGAGQRWQVMDQSRSQGQPESATAMLGSVVRRVGTYIMCITSIPSITSLLQYLAGVFKNNC